MDATSDPSALGAFLTDGERLYQVIRANPGAGTVFLEDSGVPSRPWVERKVKDLARDGFRLVRPTVSR